MIWYEGSIGISIWFSLRKVIIFSAGRFLVELKKLFSELVTSRVFITRVVPHQFKSFNKLAPSVRAWHQFIMFSFSRYSRSLVSSFTSFITSQLTKLTNKDKRQEICFEITSLMFNLLVFFFTIFNFWNNLTADAILEIVI